MAFCDGYTTQAFRAARDRDIPELRTAPQMRADALALLAEHLIGCDHATTKVVAAVLVQVDLADLERRAGLASVHSTGTTSSASAMRRWCAEASIVPVVMGGRSQPLDLGRAERLCTPAQKLALVARDGACVWCDAPAAWTDAHHIRHWADGGATDLENMVLLCRSCHTRIHDTDWEVERRDGEAWIIPPPRIDPDRTPIPAARARTAPGRRARGEARAPDSATPSAALF